MNLILFGGLNNVVFEIARQVSAEKNIKVTLITKNKNIAQDLFAIENLSVYRWKQDQVSIFCSLFGKYDVCISEYAISTLMVGVKKKIILAHGSDIERFGLQNIKFNISTLVRILLSPVYVYRCIQAHTILYDNPPLVRCAVKLIPLQKRKIVPFLYPPENRLFQQHYFEKWDKRMNYFDLAVISRHIYSEKIKNKGTKEIVNQLGELIASWDDRKALRIHLIRNGPDSDQVYKAMHLHNNPESKTEIIWHEKIKKEDFASFLSSKHFVIDQFGTGLFGLGGFEALLSDCILLSKYEPGAMEDIFPHKFGEIVRNIDSHQIGLEIKSIVLTLDNPEYISNLKDNFKAFRSNLDASLIRQLRGILHV